MEQLFTKLLSSLTEPVQLVLLLWIICLMREKKVMSDVNTKLLLSQHEIGVTMTKIACALEALVRRGAK